VGRNRSLRFRRKRKELDQGDLLYHWKALRRLGLMARDKSYYWRHREKLLEANRKYSRENRGKINLSLKKYRRRLRKEALEKLGGKCSRCGFSDWRALQIDHIKGGGSRERKETKQASEGLHRLILRTPLKTLFGKYQLLCANCNWIKKYEEKEIRNA
jgi:hypothetical protein